MDYILSPHNDDESLFAAYAALRFRPKVIVVLRSFVEARYAERGWAPGPTFEIRERETAASCAVLGCEYEQWTFPDDAPPWDEIARALSELPDVGRVWAPLDEPGGHPHHNEIAAIARDVFGRDVTYYSTYTHARGKTTTGERVEPEPGWEDAKRAALACYVSQATHPATQAAFRWPLDEYVSATER